MRKILLLLAVSFIQLAVAAEELPQEMYMANDAGGFVVLTVEPCAFENVAKEYPYRAYATESSDIVNHAGCWDSPDTSALPTELYSKSEGAGEPPTIRVIPMVNTWWAEGGNMTFFQNKFKPEKTRRTDTDRVNK